MFLYLSLTVKNDFEKVYNPSVDKGLENYLKPFILEGDNKYYCEKCQDKVEAEKGVKLASLPKILTIHLNRFDLDYETMNRKKLNNRVTFPFILNMNKFLKPYEEIEKENSKDPSNKSIEISSNPADEESWLNYQAEALKLSEKKAKKKAAVTYEDYEDFLSKKVISPEKRDHSGLNLMVPSRIDAVSVGDNSQSKPEKKELALETLASLKESQKELDKKLNKLQKPKSDIPEPKAQIDMDELTGLEMLILSQQNEDSGPKSTDDTSKSRSNMEFSEKDNSPQKSFNEETDYLTRELRQHEKEQKAIFEQYIKEGSHVYELYSIMIHSGSAWGGHYYTYIKSFEDGQWYNFDDRSVIRISVKEIEKVFGDDIPNKNNGSSAYMLMYRLQEKVFQEEEVTIQDFPQSTKEVIEIEKQEEIKRLEEERRKKEEKEKELLLRVFYKGAEQMVLAKKDQTLEELMLIVQSEFEITEEFGNFRLRNYSMNDGILQETYEGKEQKTLEELKFKAHKVLAVETKDSNEKWMEYDPNKIVIKINIWRPNLFELEESALKPHRIYLNNDSTLRMLMKEIEEKFNIPIDRQIVMRRNAYGSRGYTETMNKDEASLEKNFSALRIFNGLNLYVEEGVRQEGESTKWDKEFESEKHRCTIKFNNPAKDMEGQSPIYENEIIVDNRMGLLELKQLIGEYLNIDIDTFIMKRNGKLGTELRDLKNKLVDYNITGYVSIYLQLGVPAKSGEYVLVFCLGELHTEETDGLNFNYEDLFTLQIGNREKVSEVKARVIMKLAEKKPPINATMDTIRLRERNGLYIGQILHDNNYMKDYSLYDNKVIVVEQLKEKQTDEPSKIMIYVRYLDAKNFHLEEPKEVFVPKEKTTLHQVGQEVSNALNIPLDDIQCFRVQSLSSFTRADLLIENVWVNLKGNGYLVSSYPWYLIKDGYLLIIKNTKENIDKEKAKEVKPKKKATTAYNPEQKFTTFSVQPKETSIKIMVKKKADIEKTQDDTDLKKEETTAQEKDKQKRPHEV